MKTSTNFYHISLISFRLRKFSNFLEKIKTFRIQLLFLKIVPCMS